ncbi:MAG: thioredoxin family protein [Chitinophagales bacterium]|nr:thioredoxin family protein [Chitinophagales bacterium]
MIELNDQNYKDLLQVNSKVVIKFYAGWCGSCRLIAPKFQALSEKAEYEDVFFAEANAELNPELRALAGVNNLPFFASFKNGQLAAGFPSAKIEAVEELTKAI